MCIDVKTYVNNLVTQDEFKNYQGLRNTNFTRKWIQRNGPGGQ